MDSRPEHDLHILVVTKRLHTGRAIATRLRNIGYNAVDSFQQAQDALNFLGHGRIDLVVTGKQLSEMDGAQFAALLRTRVGSDLPILLICDQITPEEVLGAVEHGVNDIMVEPHGAKKFMTKIAALRSRITATDPSL